MQLKKARRRADAFPMRALLEFLGIVHSDGRRREPVALPAWARRVLRLLPVGAIFTLTLLTTGVWLLIRSAFS